MKVRISRCRLIKRMQEVNVKVCLANYPRLGVKKLKPESELE